MYANILSLSPSTFAYVLRVCKGCGHTIGDVATQAREFESEMNAWNRVLDAKEMEAKKENGK